MVSEKFARIFSPTEIDKRFYLFYLLISRARTRCLALERNHPETIENKRLQSNEREKRKRTKIFQVEYPRRRKYSKWNIPVD